MCISVIRGWNIRKISSQAPRQAATGSVTAVCPMANTKPVNDNATITKYMIEKGKEFGVCDIFPIGAMTKKMAGEELTEMGDMVSAGAVGFSDDGLPVASAEVFRRLCRNTPRSSAHLS